jgi:hypothetical protein
MVARWKLGNDAKDNSANTNNSTLTGTPTWVSAGKIGVAISLNGTMDYVDCSNGASLNFTNKLTLSAWIKPTSLANSSEPYSVWH